jgi:hypothetical protein
MNYKAIQQQANKIKEILSNINAGGPGSGRHVGFARSASESAHNASDKAEASSKASDHSAAWAAHQKAADAHSAAATYHREMAKQPVWKSSPHNMKVDDFMQPERKPAPRNMKIDDFFGK